MTFPFESLVGAQRELGLLAGVVIGFLFGFVLERAGFGNARKLAAQFYGTDMTVFKVMFTAIVTAMLGAVALAGLGLVDLKAVSDSATSFTYLWPMVAGGLLLGVGFIVSGYCPGTSLVATASGKLDGLFTALGVVAGTLVYSELQPLLGGFHTSGNLGNFYLYEWLKLAPATLAAGVAVAAMAMFFGAEKVEQWLARAPLPAADRPPRNWAFAGLGAAAAVTVFTLLVPAPSTAKPKDLLALTPDRLAQRVLDEPWNLRIVDLRPAADCSARRVPGAECVTDKDLEAVVASASEDCRDLVVIAGSSSLPAPLAHYPGQVQVLSGGFAAWERFALTPPELPGPQATPADRENYRLRSGLHAALTGARPPPPPPPPSAGPAPKKKAGGGCG